MKKNKLAILKTIGMPVVAIGGIIILALIVWLPQKHTLHKKNSNQNNSSIHESSTYQNKDYVNYKTNTLPEKKGLTGELFEKIPDYFKIAFSVNIKSIKQYFWSHSLLSLANQPLMRRKLDSLDVSLAGIDTLSVGLLPRYSTVKWVKNALKFSMPPLTFLIVGREVKMEALRHYWKNSGGKQRFYKQGDFQLGFPMGIKPYLFAGTYKTNLKPIIQLVEGTHKGYDLCRKLDCRKTVKKLGLIPDILLLYKPKVPLRVKGNLKISSLVLGMELNPDGVLFRARIESTISCKSTVIKLQKYIRQSLLKLKLKDNFLKRTITQCSSDKIVVITISAAASEIKNQFIQLGLLNP
jgi:hypothetical protein